MKVLLRTFFVAAISHVHSVAAQQITPQVTTATSGASTVKARSELVPFADYHVHLLGPYALPLPDPLPAEVKLPPDVEQLLTARAKLAGNVASVADLKNVFTEDAQLLDAYINPTGWMRDKYWFMRYIDLLPPTTRVRYVANAFEVDQHIGFVAGTIKDMVGGSHFENFTIALRRGRDRRWRIVSEAATRVTPPRYSKPITAARLIVDLDEAGIKKALVLSEAFWLGRAGDSTRHLASAVSGEDAVRKENDWTAQQVAMYPGRLVMACGINPLLDFATAEVNRCAKIPQVIGMKMNLGDAGFSFSNQEHQEKLRRVFQAANANHMALVIHLEPGRFYGPKEVEWFLSLIAAAAPDIPIQIAHLAGNGPGITSPEALESFARARKSGDPRARNLYFDFAGLVYKGMSKAQGTLMATRMRELGLDRVLFGSDSSPGTNGNPPASDQWRETIRSLPLTDEELAKIAANVAPYLQ